MSGATGRFSEPVMWRAMRQVARQLDVPAQDATLLRLTNNAVFALPTAGLVIRITRSLALADRVHKVARLGAWFEQVGAPTIRLAHRIDQPVPVGGLLATVWRYVPPMLPAPAGPDLGRVLRAFHALPPPPFPVPSWDPVADARIRLADAEALGDRERAFLLGWCDRLEARLARLRDRGEWRLIHGDAHVGNLLRESETRVVLCDFDSTCRGPWPVDLAAVAVGEIRFGRANAHNALAAAYGYDVTRDPDWPLLREVRELKLVVSAVPLLASTPGVAAEFRIRLTSIMDGDENVRWTPYADLTRPSGGDRRP
jgi:Putative homoserine kinase type II (protein kinase fold)